MSGLKKFTNIFFALLIFCLSGLGLKAQTGSLELIENKGQWDTTIRFRADLPDATFFLQKHGFSVLLQSPSDMDALRQFMHGQPAGNTTNPALIQCKNQGKQTLHFTKKYRENPVPGNSGLSSRCRTDHAFPFL